MARRGDATTLVEEVYDRLRHEVLGGGLPPGQRLAPAELRVRYDVSVGVMREALTRLAESHLVATTPNQGFRVVVLSPAEILDLTRVRTTVEGLALRMATERGDLQWQSEVLAAHYRLANTRPTTDDDPEIPSEAWTAAHAAFHRTLIAACGVPTLLSTCAALSDAMTLYRNSTVGPAAAGGRDAEAEHRAIVDAVLAGDADLAIARLGDHFDNTARRVLRLAGRRPVPPPSGA